jgi:hypothetical protein
MRVRTTHLSSSAAVALSLTDAERIERIRSARWIGYTRARQILDQLEALLAHPKTHRMPNLLLVGDTNNGKTMIVSRFHAQHPEAEKPRGEGMALPVLLMQAPPVPEESRFYNAILDKVRAPYRPGDRIDSKQFQAIRILSRLETRMLIIDEIHHILAGTMHKQRQFLNTIKYLGNELQVPIVGVGTEDAFHAVQSDPQLANRFEPTLLPRWKMGTEYLKLLASFERMLPLKEVSALTEQSLALKILSMSEGVIGEISALLVRAAVRAVDRRSERIDAKLLDTLGWTAPSERKWTNAHGTDA